ncbi:MAG: hypothetical protein JOZ24_04355 [Candidatus Eremiobacteraeota bacterium]|nr:hypothetical protein [Candidatus Eremiobacteraeota bacterium]
MARSKVEAGPVSAAAIDEVRLSMMGDWGVANWHALVGWIAASLRWRTSPRSRFVIHTIGPYRDTLEAVIDRTCDLCISSPISDARMAREGKARFERAHPELRALGVYPHHDRLMLGIGEDVAERYGIRSYEDLALRRPPLRLVGAVRDGVNYISWAAEQVLNAYGVAWDDIPAWGGEWVTTTRPHDGLAAVANGQADGIFFEAIMNWHRVMAKRPLRILPIGVDVLDDLRERYGIERGDIEPGEFAGVTERLPQIEFSDWLFVVRDDMPEELAYLIAQVLIDDRAAFERQYTHRPLRESPLHYPIEPAKVCRTAPVPLHPGAERFYRERDLLK